MTSRKEIAGPLVRLACQRHLRDLDEAEARGIWWDWPAAEYAIEFFESVLYLAGGEHEGKPFLLHASQVFIIGSLFGWKGADGYRRFRVAYIEEGKGNGKSPLLGGVGLFMLIADGEPRAEVYAVGHDKDQAQVLFRDAVAMVDQSIDLDSRITRSGGRGKEWNLAYHETGSFFRPISSEHVGGRGKSGPRPHCVLIDELHEHPSSAMVEFMRAGTKGRRQALILMITNSGVYDPEAVWWHYHDYAAKVTNRQLENDSFFAFVCGLDPCAKCAASGKTQPSQDCKHCDSWKDRKVWKKANPLLGVSITEKYLEEQVREASGMPSKQSLVRRLNFCEAQESADPFVTSEVWAANGEAIDPDRLRGRRCFGGLDLSSKNALTSLELIFEEDVDGKKDVLSFFWTPLDGLNRREERDKAPYQQWVNDGFLIAKPGKTIDYAWVANQIGDLTKLYDIVAIHFDKWRIEDLEKDLDDAGVNVTLKPCDQGYQSMSPCIEALEDELLESRLRHGNHPILTWCIANTRVVQDPAKNRKFDRRKSTGHIDGAVALAMAGGLLVSQPEEASYQVTVIG